MAQWETEALERGDYDEFVRRAEHRRGELFRDTANILARLAAIFIGGALIAAALLWFWHLLAPESWQYLTEDQLADIQTVLFSGLAAGIAQSYIRPRLNPSEGHSNNG
ncbi:hypothetical protein [Halorhodospira sp. 9622]|uniref:hypothetical protein n=1 Tax=Halorhodospira sp. 9622 TaxID=2899136 RepID=UPI001EE82A6F|nr:hypothetical protein [Halorhodospira sp. 9622]MCG5538938.1 hypothetical protein [Halorhodospira sp. 9622]